MKNILLFALFFMALGCSKPDKIAKQIKANIQENAGGVEMNYKPVETKELMTLNYGQFINFLNMRFETDETLGCMSSSRILTLVRSRNLNINNCNSLKCLTAIAYTLC